MYRPILNYAEENVFIKEFTSLAFSSENKFLLTQGGNCQSKDDWALIYWAWDRAQGNAGGRAMAATRITAYGIMGLSSDADADYDPAGV
jgi:hypothetical protein